MSQTLHIILAVLHALSAAAWLGAMFYSVTVLQPRAKAYFERDEQFEDFAATLAHGARWKVLGAFACVGITGGLLVLFFPPRPMTTPWLAFMIAKTVLFFAALMVFSYASWRLWPRRVIARPEEIPAMQRRFRMIGWTLLLLVGGAFVLGVMAHR